VQALRGSVQPLTDRTSLWVTVHPSYLLRLPDADTREREYRAFVADLAGARQWLAAHAPS
jgi:DNA polymerase